MSTRDKKFNSPPVRDVNFTVFHKYVEDKLSMKIQTKVSLKIS